LFICTLNAGGRADSISIAILLLDELRCISTQNGEMVMIAQAAPYGTWQSPITAELVAQGEKRFDRIVIDENQVYWVESRPEEGGRYVLLQEGKLVTPPEYSVRTRVHEYGGGAYTVHKGTIYFSNDKDGRLYRQHGNRIEPLTEEGVCYADMHWTPEGIVAIGEQDGKNFLSLIQPDGEVSILAQGADFYSSPTYDTHCQQLAWLQWRHPNMPWDGTELMTAELRDGTLHGARRVAGGESESIFQPQWSPQGVLHWVSDKTDWWNIYNEKGNLCPMEAEFGLPGWIFGMSTYAFVEDRILCAIHQEGGETLNLLDPATGDLEELSIPATTVTQIRATDHFAAVMAGAPNHPTSVMKLNVDTLEHTILGGNVPADIDEGYFSIPESLKWETAYGYYYPPRNPNYTGPADQMPPLLVKNHGGPTSATTTAQSLKIQYWTSRGFAVLDVNYRGSSGYGREYRDALKGKWGVADVEDCEGGALALVEKGLADPKMLAITGGSAGGYTTLCALTFGDTFSAGGSYYGISDLEAMVQDTHKFESRYLDGLIGPYPDRKDLYEERSPIHSVAQLSCPVIFFQGLEDKVVPPNQAEMMVEALQEKGIQVEYITYPHEQHGFRAAETVSDALSREHAFYVDVFEIDRPQGG
jgi:dipeptidyl aminopeptidase/acylaminoacyl peptidase